MDNVFRGKWWKFSNHQVDERGRLHPDFAGELREYDPWREYWEWVKDWRTSRPPYLKLFDLNLDMSQGYISDPYQNSLMNDLDYSYSRHAGGYEKIIEWCNEYGLLGILPYKLRALEYEEGIDSPTRKLTQRCVSGNWESYLTSEESCELLSQEQLSELELSKGDWKISGGELFTLSHRYPTVEWDKNIKSTLKWFNKSPPTSQIENTYFPQAPLSPEFWANYVEPVYNFRDGIQILYSSTYTLLGESTLETKRNASRCLNILAEQVINTTRVNEEGQLDFYTFAPSLLNIYAAMILMDLADGSRLHFCNECNNIFASGTKRATYCSTTCRNRFNRRKYRERHNK